MYGGGITSDYELSDKQVILNLREDNEGLVAEIERLSAENLSASREAKSLALSLWRRYYKAASPDFGLTDTTAGIISQIDNMTAGLGAENERLNARLKVLQNALEWFDLVIADPNNTEIRKAVQGGNYE